jgi:hypothetical protein
MFGTGNSVLEGAPYLPAFGRCGSLPKKRKGQL